MFREFEKDANTAVVLLFVAVMFFGGIIFVVVWITDHIRTWRAGKKSDVVKPAHPMAGVLGGVGIGGVTGFFFLIVLKQATFAAILSGDDSAFKRWAEAFYSTSAVSSEFVPILIIVTSAILGGAFQYYINRIPTEADTDGVS